MPTKNATFHISSFWCSRPPLICLSSSASLSSLQFAIRRWGCRCRCRWWWCGVLSLGKILFFWVSSLPPNAIHIDNCSSTSLPPALSLPMTLFDSLLNTIRDLLHFRPRFQIQNAFRQLSVCSGNSTLIVGSILKITETTSPENYFQWEILQKSITRK